MFGKKKRKAEETFTPADLAQLVEQNDKTFGRISAQRSSKELTTTQKWQRRSFWTLIILVLILLILYLLSLFLTQWGDLVISVNGDAVTKGIVVSENADLSDGRVRIGAENVKNVTNITYDWLPLDELDKKDGSYNGKNHLAYTFYLGNNGSEEAEYDGVLSITGVSKGMDEAVRIMVYKNGKPLIYAKKKFGSDKPEEDTIQFIDDKIVMQTGLTKIKPKSSDKYTIVSWVEGNDPECVNDIMGGYMRMSMLFSIADEKE